MCGEEHANFSFQRAVTSPASATWYRLLDDLVVVRPILKRWGTAPDQRPPSRCQRMAAREQPAETVLNDCEPLSLFELQRVKVQARRAEAQRRLVEPDGIEPTTSSLQS